MSSERPELRERVQEWLFVVLLFVGALISALGIAFFVIGVSIGTESPAPYMPQQDKTLLVVLSAGAIVVGGLVIRAAGRVVGW